ncbi:helix-turn-helix transcriptional regulator [Neobacillus niacini]|uniref:helix-turn-helix domain-containing protein n=1 Tax=Neobacillus niacini TaxID=86668 RepID=UPI002FFDD6F9
MNQLGSIVRRLREEKGYSLVGLAERSYVSASYINKIELGTRKRPSVAILKDIAQGLGVEMDYLLTGSIPTLEQLVFSHDFTIGDSKTISIEGKELLIQLVNTIYKMDWNNENIYGIHKVIIDLKEKIE